MTSCVIGRLGIVYWNTMPMVTPGETRTEKNQCSNFYTCLETSLEPEVVQSLDGYPVVIKVPVRWGDMDAFQHVNNIVYFQYFESVRIEYFERIHAMDHLRETGVGPILASTQCRFRFPVTYPDTLLVGAKVTDLGEDRFTHRYLAVSQIHEKVAAEGDGVVVTFNYRTNQKAPIPAQIRQRIYGLENGLKGNNR
jgi:acyl-CoA thioester hydrolase